MTPRTPDYLATARELRARRLGQVEPPAPSPPAYTETMKTPDPTPATSEDSTLKTTRKHALITTSNRLGELATSLEDVSRVALDLETTGLDPRRRRIRLLTLATERGTWIVDCFEIDPRPLFPVLAQKKVVMHNGIFDLGFLFAIGFELGEGGEVIATMLLSLLLG